MTTSAALIEQIRGRLIVSCQAPPLSPMHDPYVIARLALTAERCGAAGVRIDTPMHIDAARALCRVPIIGLHKQAHPGSAVYITPTASAATGVIGAGAAIVAVDATARLRPNGERLEDLVALIHAHGRLVMADVATDVEGLAAAALGADLIATTLSGYTGATARQLGPDFALIEQLVSATGVPVVCEGRVRTPSDVRQAFIAGAHAVVVGAALTAVDQLVRQFAAATPAGPAAVDDA